MQRISWLFFIQKNRTKNCLERVIKLKVKKYDFNQWLKAAGIRAIKTVAQTAVALIGTSTVMNEVNWAMIISASCLSGVVSILTSVAGLPELEEIESE